MIKPYKSKKHQIKFKINLRIGDKVKIIAGTEKGNIGFIKKLLKRENKVIVENINLKFKHQKPLRQEETGEIKQVEFPIHRSNVKKLLN